MEILKKLQNIEPDREYSKRSRMVILSTSINEAPEWSLFAYLFTRRKIATALSLAAIFAVFILGGLFGGGSYSNLPGLDPISLRAEAQAIDIQIKLTSLVYENPELIHKTTTTAAIVLDVEPKDLILLDSKSEEIKILEEELGAIRAGAEGSITVDAILGILSR